MKLNKDNFTKTIDNDIVIYSYNCNDTNFYLELVGQNKNRNINVFSGSLDDRKDLLTTKSSLEAWNHFENLLKVCGGEQGSSGGGNLGKNPEQNPNILPLLAFNGTSGGMIKFTLFAVMDDKSQVKIFNFEVDSNTIPEPLPQNVFTVDWTNEDVTQFLKCEVLLKEYDAIKFEEEPNSKVFLFIPKSIANQGGEEGGNTQKGEPIDEPPNGIGGQPKENGEPKDEEPKDDDLKTTEPPGGTGGQPKKGEKPSDEEPKDDEPKTNEPPNGIGKEPKQGDEPKDDETNEPKEDEKPSDEEPKDKDEDGKQDGSKNKPKELNFSETIQKLVDSTDGDYSPSELLSIFRNEESGEIWLSSNDFNKIKRDLNLPSNTTPRQLSKEIINSK